MRSAIILALLGLLSGCAQHEFDLMEPADLAERVGRDQPTIIERSPLNYRLQAAEGRLVMNIRNPADQPVVLLGEQSYVVDPEGQSRPLPTQTIAPGSFIKSIFPPLRDPRAEPGFGIGIGVGVSTAGPREDAPVLLSTQNVGPYWSWRDGTPVRMRLAFRQGDQTFSHEFTFRRMRL